MILHGFVEYFAQGSGVIFLGLPDLKLRPRACRAHSRAFYHHGSILRTATPCPEVHLLYPFHVAERLN
jgi:hypothetical protein